MEPRSRSSVQCLATVIENVAVARDTYRLRLEAPAIARSILPGQFVMIRAGLGTDPLLGRPFALYDIVRDREGLPIGLEVVYLVFGRGTAALAARRSGDTLPIWGPLGNHFGPPPEGRALLVAGGIGQTPFLALARWWFGSERYGDQVRAFPQRPRSIGLCYGVRSSSYLAGLDDFRAAGMDVSIATDDGTAGHHGFVTDLAAAELEGSNRPDLVVGCGPPAMLAALARLTARYDVPCDVSLENHMACGFGVCFSCVCPIRLDDGTIDLKRVCVEGPIFDARRVAFEA